MAATARLIIALCLISALFYAVQTADFSEGVVFLKNAMDNLEDVLIEAGPMGPVYVFFIYLVSTVFMVSDAPFLPCQLN